MRTLNEITAAARTHGPATDGELRLAIVALDIILATQDENPDAFDELADLPLDEAVTWENHPMNPEFLAWYAEQGEPEPVAPPVPGDYVTQSGEDVFRVATPGYNPIGARAYGVPVVYELQENEGPQGLYGLDLTAVELVTLHDHPELFQKLVNLGKKPTPDDLLADDGTVQTC
jgi:hypothetical protein